MARDGPHIDWQIIAEVATDDCTAEGVEYRISVNSMENAEDRAYVWHAHAPGHYVVCGTRFPSTDAALAAARLHLTSRNTTDRREALVTT